MCLLSMMELWGCCADPIDSGDKKAGARWGGEIRGIPMAMPRSGIAHCSPFQEARRYQIVSLRRLHGCLPLQRAAHKQVGVLVLEGVAQQQEGWA